MWGAESWGEMIWGGAVSLPLLGPAGLVVVSLCLLLAGYRVRSRRRAR